MKRNITVVIKGNLTDKAIENYYKRLWIALDNEYGEDIIKELYEKLKD